MDMTYSSLCGNLRLEAAACCAHLALLEGAAQAAVQAIHNSEHHCACANLDQVLIG
jgi:hypothetical protein